MSVSLLDLEKLADHHGFTVVRRACARSGVWLPSLNTIVLNPRLGYRNELCILAHELGHALLGHAACTGFADRQERQADLWAAGTLITRADYERAEQLVGPNLGALAEELDVMTWVITVWREKYAAHHTPFSSHPPIS